MKYIKPRGTQDWFLNDAKEFRSLTNLLFLIANLNGYSEMQTPIFESAELFIRSVGANSDIVKKEFYNFKDKGDRELVLRPEGTAGVIRAVVEKKLINKIASPIKLCYSGPMFRYERPQSGRLRQFHQFGAECINSTSVYDDIDTLLFAQSIIQTLKIKNTMISINDIGNFKSREKWIDALKKYFVPFRKQLSEVSQARLDTNPLRILDDKEDAQKDFVRKAPQIDAFLTVEEKQRFATICNTLKIMQIDFKIDKSLVRGLDYYTNFVFEINSKDEKLAGQPTLIGGGRYANLVKELDGPDCPCVGFALGIERLLLVLQYENIKIAEPVNTEIVIASLSEKTSPAAIVMISLLRSNGISAVCKFDTYKLTKHFDYATSLNAKYVIILGEKELQEQKVTIKNQKTLKQEAIAFDKIVDFIRNQK